MQNEADLVRRAREGDQQAFAQLYEENFARIYRYIALRIGDRMEAEDMTQQVFLNALRSISSFKWQGIPFVGWLFRIARNQVIDHHRKKTKETITDLDERMVSNEENPEIVVERHIEMERILAASRRLTEDQRQVISLRFAGGLSIVEVAQVMGKSQGAVKALQHSAIAALRRVLLVEKNEEVERV